LLAQQSPVADQAIGLDDHTWRSLDSVLSITDADGDAVTQFEIYDSEGGDNWWADDASAGYVTSGVSDIWFQRDAVASEQTLWVRAFYSEEWGAWGSFDMSTV
jgi:hypothetical protein